MHPPEFWFTDGPLARALSPFGHMYGAVTAWRVRHSSPADASVPVVSIGNLTVGGTGKTPVVREIVQRLKSRDIRTAVVLRGYGGRLAGPVKVDTSVHTALDVGDEALLHARDGMTWVARNRAAGARAATSEGAEIIVLDDAHQHTTLKKDASIIVVDGRRGFGNHRILPAGPLREDVRAGLARADLLAILGPDNTRVTGRIADDLPVLQGDLEPASEAVHLRRQKVVAFAGLGQPEKFFETLRDLGANVVAAHPFDDHHLYQPADIQPILDEAFSIGAMPVTTEKDAMRLSPDQRQQVNVLRIGVTWKNAGALDALLDRLLNRG